MQTNNPDQTIELPARIVEALGSIGYQITRSPGETCPDCGNSKACQHCYGRGYDPDATGWQACPICGGDGICVHCRQEEREGVL